PYIQRPVARAKRESLSARSIPLETWVRRLPKPVAVLACDDIRGFQLLEACRNAGIEVPSEVAVMGVGNDELLCALASPALSSIALWAVDGGYHAAHALDGLMGKSSDVPTKIVVQTCGLVIRDS